LSSIWSPWPGALEATAERRAWLEALDLAGLAQLRQQITQAPAVIKERRQIALRGVPARTNRVKLSRVRMGSQKGKSSGSVPV
jgi:hypothetical protein